VLISTLQQSLSAAEEMVAREYGWSASAVGGPSDRKGALDLAA